MDRNHVLVCVTRQKTCERLIIEGHNLADELNAALSVLHVAKPGINFLGNPIEGDALEYLYKISSEHGADMTLLRADDVLGAISAHADKLQANCVVMGRSKGHDNWDMTNDFLIRRPDLDVHIILT